MKNNLAKYFNCFNCFRKLKLLYRKKSDEKWLVHLQTFCTQNFNKHQWCNLILDSYKLLKQHSSMNQDLLYQIKSTNIPTDIIKLISNHYNASYDSISNDDQIQKAMTQSENVYKFIISLYASYLKLKFSQIINPSSVTLKKIAFQNKKFVEMMKANMSIYYGLEERELIGGTRFYQVTLTQFIIQKMLQNQQLLQTLTSIIKTSSKEQNNRIMFNIQKNLSLQLDQFGVRSQFLLNQSSVQKLKLQESLPSIIQQRLPYLGSVQMLKQLNKPKSFISKAKTIQNLIKQIEKSIINFYQKCKIDAHLIDIDQQSLVHILGYVITQANQTNLLSNVLFIHYFINFGQSEYTSKSVQILMKSLNLIQRQNFKKRQNVYSPEKMISEGEINQLPSFHNYFEHVSSL